MRHEDIREHLVVGALRAITHAQPGGEKNPFAEVFWWEEFVIAGVLRLVRGLIRRGLQCAETNNDCCDYRRHSLHGCSPRKCCQNDTQAGGRAFRKSLDQRLEKRKAKGSCRRRRKYELRRFAPSGAKALTDFGLLTRRQSAALPQCHRVRKSF